MTVALAIAATLADLARNVAAAVPPALPLALVAGTHAATWGAYKDAPYEGYHPLRQLRTLVIAGAAAVVVVVTGLVDPRAVVPAVGVVYTLERLATEWWKTIARVDDQSAYTIPMRLGFRGRPVDVNWIRYGVGALVLAAMAGLGAGVHVAQAAAEDAFGGLSWLVLVATVGGLGGWATAVGGAWKDAPVEGFSFWKFLRSPFVATAWAVPLSLMTSDWVPLCLAAGGLSVFTIETYKTFWTAGRPPGKFANQPLRHQLPTTRRVLGLLHTAAWLMLAVGAMREALSSLAPSLRVADVGRLTAAKSSTLLHLLAAPHAFSGVVSSTLVAGAALLAAVFVLRANVRLTARTGVRVEASGPQSRDALGPGTEHWPPVTRQSGCLVRWPGRPGSLIVAVTGRSVVFSHLGRPLPLTPAPPAGDSAPLVIASATRRGTDSAGQ